MRQRIIFRMNSTRYLYIVAVISIFIL